MLSQQQVCLQAAHVGGVSLSSDYPESDEENHCLQNSKPSKYLPILEQNTRKNSMQLILIKCFENFESITQKCKNVGL